MGSITNNCNSSNCYTNFLFHKATLITIVAIAIIVGLTCIGLGGYNSYLEFSNGINYLSRITQVSLALGGCFTLAFSAILMCRIHQSGKTKI